jgi:hypothetical protein
MEWSGRLLPCQRFFTIVEGKWKGADDERGRPAFDKR